MAYNKAYLFKILYLCSVLGLNYIGGKLPLIIIAFALIYCCFLLYLFILCHMYTLTYLLFPAILFFLKYLSSGVLKSIHGRGSWPLPEVRNSSFYMPFFIYHLLIWVQIPLSTF